MESLLSNDPIDNERRKFPPSCGGVYPFGVAPSEFAVNRGNPLTRLGRRLFTKGGTQVNTKRANTPVERKRKNAITVCKHILKILQSDIEDEIDTHLDAALDALAEVHMQLHGAHERALEERRELEALEEAREIALINGRANAKRVAPRDVEAAARRVIVQLTDEEKKALIREFLA